MIPNSKPVSHSRTWTFFKGQWQEGNVPSTGPRTHGLWLGSTVFDGARAFEGVTPDLDRHRARVNNPPSTSDLSPSSISIRGWVWRTKASPASRPMPSLHPADVLAAERRRRRRALRSGNDGLVPLHLRSADSEAVGSAITLSPFRRPTAECAPVGSKASCLYPNCSRALIEAASRGFQNCLMLDMLGNVAEFGNSNVFMAKDGAVYTPASERHLPERHYPAAGDRPLARRRRHGDRGHAALCRFPRRGRDLFDR